MSRYKMVCNLFNNLEKAGVKNHIPYYIGTVIKDNQTNTYIFIDVFNMEIIARKACESYRQGIHIGNCLNRYYRKEICFKYDTRYQGFERQLERRFKSLCNGTYMNRNRGRVTYDRIIKRILHDKSLLSDMFK